MPQFSIKTKIFFGRESGKEVFACMLGLGLKRLVIVADKNLKDSLHFMKLMDKFRDAGFNILSIKFPSILVEPTYDLVDEFTNGLRTYDMDAIIAVGGGSVMDAVKGAAILLRNQGKAVDYRGMDKVNNPGIPVICYPTTAGTGSEVTHTASFIDKGSNTKLGINGKNVSPIFGVLMPELTFSCPPKVSIFAGLDVMVHAIEAVSALTANTVTVMFGCNAFSLVYENFKTVLADPENYKAREGMLLGSYYAGIAMMNAGGGPASGISYPLGVHYKVPHGLAGGIFLPHVMDFNISKGYEGYARLYDRLPAANLLLSDAEKSAKLLLLFKKMYDDIEAPKDLSDYGVGGRDLSPLVELTMRERVANLKLNPVPFGEAEVRALLEKVIQE